VRLLHDEHAPADVGVAHRFVEPTAIQLLVLEERQRHAVDDAPYGEERLAGHEVVAVDLAPDVVVGIDEAHPEDLLDRSLPVAFLGADEGGAERRVEAREDRESDLLVELR
jgi:hypothetical protein